MTCNNSTSDWRVQYRGDTWRIPVASFVDGVPENLVGTELRFTLKRSLNDPDPGALQRRYVVPASPAAVAGVAEIPVPASMTAGVLPGSYHYDIQRVRAGAPPDVLTIESGRFTCVNDVTRTIETGPAPVETGVLLPYVDAAAIETPPPDTSWLFLNLLGLPRLMRPDRSVEPLAGGGGAGGTTYTQATPATQWQVIHGLGRSVSVDVYAADGELILPSVTRISDDEIRITHATPQSGIAVIT